MASPSLILSIGNRKETVSGKAYQDNVSDNLRKKIYERDNHTCKFCGFRSEKYQDIHFLDQNSASAQPANMATVCMFCHQCFNIERVSDMRSGVLIWLPEIAQPDLHNIARAIYVARISQGPVSDAARKAFDVMMKRREEVKNRIGTDDPYILSCVLRDYLTDGHYGRRKEKLEGIRLFPLDRRMVKEADLEFNQFPQILAYWRSRDGAFGSIPPHSWIELFKNKI